MPSAPADEPPPADHGEPRRGSLLVVATPIGNLSDLSARAEKALRDSDVIAAEDTRRTRSLLAHLGATDKELVRLDANATPHDVDRLADRVLAGAAVALVSDAGTPVVSDPGSALVRAVRARGGRIAPVPGPSAVTAALSVAGFSGVGFRFAGFLPRSGRERREAVARVAADPGVVILFEAPHRMSETLADLARSTPERSALVARELTKIHEELLSGTLERLAADHAAREWLGEITIVLGPHTRAEGVDEEAVDRRIAELLAEGRRAREVAEIASLELGISKRDAYERANRKKR